MSLRALRYDGHCAACGTPTPAKLKAWYDSTSKTVTCEVCHLSVADNSPAPTSPWAPPPSIDSGTAGISAKKEYDRRVAKHERQIEQKWGTGRIGRVAKALSTEPQSTTAWAQGAEGERKLGARLDTALAGIGFVLHDRRVPGRRDANIDHIAVTSTGVWVIDAKNYSGKIERRDVGGWLRTDLRLYVAGRDQTKLVTGMTWQVDKVREMLDLVGFATLPINPVLCFTNSEWPLLAKPIVVNGVTATWPANLVETASAPGAIDASVIDLVARHLSSQLPAAS